MYVPGFKYNSKNGTHVTKVEYTIVSDDQSFSASNTISEAGATRVKFSDPAAQEGESKETYFFVPQDLDLSDYRYLVDGSLNADRADELNSTFEVFQTFNIGSDPNKWFTLTADYYFDDFKLGTYSVRFNPYVFDVLKFFNNMLLKPQLEYYRTSQIWFPQYYDITNIN